MSAASGADDLLAGLLAAKERRAGLRRELSAGGQVLVSLTLNVPGWPKSDAVIGEAFELVRRGLVRFLAARQVLLNPTCVHQARDAAGDFFLAALAEPALAARDLKAVTEAFEASHPLGRLVDVDVTGPDGALVSSGKAKPCFLCPDVPAVVCMRRGAHDPVQVRRVVTGRIQDFLDAARRETVCRRLAQEAARAMLREIAHTPKPGLVDRLDRGCHADMDFVTFLDSSAALAVHFFDLAAAGFDGAARPVGELLPEARVLGMTVEKAMFAATGGVNTHKGLVFLMGLALAVAGRVIRQVGWFDREAFARGCREMCSGLVERELTGTAVQSTHGEAVFRRFGRGGARAEAEGGFPMALEVGLPALAAAAPDGLGHLGDEAGQAALDAALYAILAVNQDTNVLHRGGAEALEGLQTRAAAVRDASTPEARTAALAEAQAFAASRCISPGGAGDLLAVTLFLHFASRAFPRGV